MNHFIEKIKNLKLKFYFIRKNFYKKFSTKKAIEMEAQRKRAKDMTRTEIKEKVKEYFYEFRFLKEIINYANINENSKILDVGCGIKTVLHFLPGNLKIGVDSLADEYVKIYDYPKDIKIEKSFGEKLKYQNNFFDVVFITNALDHTKNPENVIMEIYRVLKNKGFIALTNELVEKDTRRDKAHPNNMREEDILKLLSGKFDIIFKKYSPWIGIRQYYLECVDSSNLKSNKKQITVLAQKREK